MAMDSTAGAHWEGDLMSGSGQVSFGSGALPAVPINWQARTEESGGVTSPDELVAAAHASCFSMALSHGLAGAGHPATALDVEATATFVPGTGITNMVLTLTGEVPGMSEEDFLAAAEDAKENCPVSQALKGNVLIKLNASLA